MGKIFIASKPVFVSEKIENQKNETHFYYISFKTFLGL